MEKLAAGRWIEHKTFGFSEFFMESGVNASDRVPRRTHEGEGPSRAIFS